MSTSRSRELIKNISEQLDINISLDVSLAEISRWRIGGNALALATPSSISELQTLVRVIREHNIPLIVVGEMSNVLFDSQGFEGVIVHIGDHLAKVTRQNNRIVAEAGIKVPVLARLASEYGLSGIEHTVGIPGTLGGLIAMNGGTQRKSIADSLVSVKVMDLEGKVFDLNAIECGFSYRTSIFQRNMWAILSAELAFTPLSVHVIQRRHIEILSSRKDRFPEDEPNCGSTFISRPELYATVGAPGKVIEEAGLKGFSIGGATVSPKHANFIVNTGGATSSDVLRLIQHIRTAVYTRTGFQLECEVRFVSCSGQILPAHLAHIESS